MLFRQLFDPSSSTYTYVLADPRSREAVVIDPVFEQHARDLALLRELGLTLVATLDTHCHADHVTGAWLMKAALGSRIGLHPVYGAENVDLPLTHGSTVRFGEHTLEVRATPGHTDGCVSFVSADHSRVFTGDALLVRATGRTDFQQGDPQKLYRSILEQLFTLPDECALYPGHDYQGRTSSTIGEERQHNPRIGGGARVEDFVGTMENLLLPHPRQLAVALPANLRSGQPEGGQAPAPPDWGPIVITYAGVPEVAPEWVARNRDAVHLLDVRAPAELEGDLGRLEHTQHLPLAELRARLAEVPTDRPVVILCQTGKRSAIAAQILTQAKHPRVASLAGGMVTWRTLGLPS